MRWLQTMKIRTTPTKETEQYIRRIMNYNDAFRKKTETKSSGKEKLQNRRSTNKLMKSLKTLVGMTTSYQHEC